MGLAEEINGLFLSDGLVSWLGLLILIIILVALVGVKKEYVALSLPILVLMGLLYLDAGLGWHFLISIVSSVFILVGMAVKK